MEDSLNEFLERISFMPWIDQELELSARRDNAQMQAAMLQEKLHELRDTPGPRLPTALGHALAVCTTDIGRLKEALTLVRRKQHRASWEMAVRAICPEHLEACKVWMILQETEQIPSADLDAFYASRDSRLARLRGDDGGN